MLNFVKLYETYEKEFSDLLCTETGKTRFFGTNEVQGAGKVITYHANLTLPVEKIEEADKTITTRYVPLGVVGAISPWNFPLSTSAGKVAGSLIAGCTVIVKPSPFTPYSALKFVELAQEVFPPGVVQILGGGPGAQDVGPLLVDHPAIAKISFTGSIPTGKKIMAGCAKTLKRITLELGGNDPCIVFPDVDIDKVVQEVTIGSFWNTAQVCIATKRVYIHESIYREFVDKMAGFVKHMKVGSSDEEGVMVGPMQNEMQYEKVKTYFADSKKNGYKFLGDDVVAASKGFFIQPTIIDNPPNDSRIVQEEPFGPILPPFSHGVTSTKSLTEQTIPTLDLVQVFGQRILPRVKKLLRDSMQVMCLLILGPNQVTMPSLVVTRKVVLGESGDQQEFCLSAILM
jgi:acyl-CoA reductase-like NAD-dependent aldehyde dehydrogenase